MFSQKFLQTLRPVRSFLARKLGLDPYDWIYKRAEKKRVLSAYPTTHLQAGGIGLSFDVNCLTSLSQVGRDYIFKLKSTDIPFEVFDQHHAYQNDAAISVAESSELARFVSEKLTYRLRMTVSTVESFKDDRYTNIMTPYWEFESGLREAAPRLFEGVDGILVSTDFCSRYFQRIIPSGVKIGKVRYPFPLDRLYPPRCQAIRSKYVLPDNAFVAFFHFNYCSSAARKNPGGVIRAFACALRGKPDAYLVIKTAGFDQYPEQVAHLEKIAMECGVARQIRFINQHLPYSEILQLEAASDVYISLHRGEGFGIGMLEAMAVGTPVIATDYGGNTDFTKSSTAFMVDYKMLPAKFPEYSRYAGVREWAEPNIDTAVSYLKALYEDRALGKLKAMQATEFIHQFFSDEAFAREMKEFMSIMENDK